MTTQYCLDSGVFINSWVKHYPPELFPCFWNHLDGLYKKKVAFVPDAVAEEVNRGGDDLTQWLKDRRKMIVMADEEIILSTGEVIRSYPKLTAEGSARSAADPWVIGFARVRGAIVVTEEIAANSLKKQKYLTYAQQLALNALKLLKCYAEQGS